MKKILSAAAAMLIALSLLMGTACASAYETESFSEIFHNRSLVPNIVGGTQYVGITPEGIVDLHQYLAYSDEVYTWINTLYYPMAGLSAEEKSAMEANIKATFAAIDEEDFVEITYWNESDYFAANISYEKLNKKKNVRKLGEYGVVSYGSEAISLRMSKEAREEDGYITGIYFNSPLQ